MRYLIFLTILATAKSKQRACDIISNEPSKRCFVKETLMKVPRSPNQLAVDRTTNTLYFSFDYRHGIYVPALLNVNTKAVSILQGVKDAFAIASDNVTGTMYFGGSHGIYKYNTKHKTLQRLKSKDLDIWWLFIKNQTIYFVKFPKLGVYYYENRIMKPVKELQYTSVQQFVFDKNDNLFFINCTGLYGLKRGYDLPVLLRDQPRFLAIASDNIGNVYLSSENGIYIVTFVVQKVRKVFDIQGVLAMTFDANNDLIYSTPHEIIKLVPV